MKLIYFRIQPELVVRRFSGAMARPRLSGAAANLLEHSICVAEDDGAGVPVWSGIIPDEILAAARSRPQFLGKGLDEVKAAFPTVYAKIAQRLVRLADGSRVLMSMEDAVPPGGTEERADLPGHTFSGWNPFTGEVE